MPRRTSEYDLAQGCEEKMKPNPDFNGPTLNRKVTDPFQALFLIASWGIFLYISLWAFENGDINRVLYGADYRGRVCGHDLDDEGRY